MAAGITNYDSRPASAGRRADEPEQSPIAYSRHYCRKDVAVSRLAGFE